MKHKVETEVLKRKPLFCFGCGKSPLMGSADGNRKLYRYKSSGLVKKTQNEVDELIAIHEYFGMDHRMTFFLYISEQILGPGIMTRHFLAEKQLLLIVH